MGAQGTQLLMMQTVAQALDASDDIVLVMQPAPKPQQMHIIGANAAFCRASLIGMTDLPGRSFASLVAEPFSPMLDQIEEAAATGISLQAEIKCLRTDGAPFWLGLHVMPAVDPRTGTARCVLLGRDITQKRAARQHGERVQQLLARVLVSVDAAVAILTQDGIILKANPALERLLSTDRDGLEGKRFADIVVPADHHRLDPSYPAPEQRKGGRGRVLNLRLLGPASPLSTRVTMVPADASEPRGFQILTIVEDHAHTALFQVAGKIRMIGLDEVKAMLGPRWPALRERAIATAEHVLHRKLGPKDSFSRTPDDGFLICFADLAEEAASFTAAMIGRDIRTRLIGQGEDAAAAGVTAIAAAVKAPAREDERQPFAILDERLNARRSEIEARARETLSYAMQTATCRLDPVFSKEGRIAHYASLPVPLQRNLASASGALPPSERANYDLDALTLRLAGELALEQTLAGGPANMFVDVCFDVFHSRTSTDAFLEACRKLDPAIRQGIVMVLTNLPPGITSSRMLDCVHRLRPFCRAVGFQIAELDLPDFDFALASNAILVVDAALLNATGHASRIERLCTQLHAMRARLMVRHIPAKTIERLLALGVDLVSIAAEIPPSG